MIVDKEALDGFISATEVIEEAAKLGISATAASLSRYQKFGLMMLPNRTVIKGALGRPANYHPLCIVELAAATWMYRGFLPSINEPTKKIAAMTRFSTDDIFYARAKFYLSSEEESLVQEYGLPELSLVEYQTDKVSNEVDEMAYKDFLKARVEAMENEFRQTIAEDNRLFLQEHRSKLEILNDMSGNGSRLSSLSAVDVFAKKEYPAAIYRILYYRAFFALRAINNHVL